MELVKLLYFESNPCARLYRFSITNDVPPFFVYYVLLYLKRLFISVILVACIIKSICLYPTDPLIFHLHLTLFLSNSRTVSQPSLQKNCLQVTTLLSHSYYIANKILCQILEINGEKSEEWHLFFQVPENKFPKTEVRLLFLNYMKDDEKISLPLQQ